MNGYKVNEGPANTDETPVEEIVDQLQEKRPFPMGMKAFYEWFERIWSGAMMEFEPGSEEMLRLSCQNVLANEIVHLPSGQTHESDIYFINRLRKVAANQICLNVINQTKRKRFSYFGVLFNRIYTS